MCDLDELFCLIFNYIRHKNVHVKIQEMQKHFRTLKQIVNEDDNDNDDDDDDDQC